MLHVAGLDAAPHGAETTGACGDSINSANDDPRVKNLRQKTGHRREWAHQEKLIKLIDVVFIQQDTIGNTAGERGNSLEQFSSATIRNVRHQNCQANDRKSEKHQGDLRIDRAVSSFMK